MPILRVKDADGWPKCKLEVTANSKQAGGGGVVYTFSSRDEARRANEMSKSQLAKCKVAEWTAKPGHRKTLTVDTQKRRWLRASQVDGAKVTWSQKDLPVVGVS